MRIIDAIYNAIDRVAPMSSEDKTELRKDAKEWLIDEKKKYEDKEIKDRDIKGKVIGYVDTWWVRTLIAVAYIWAVPKLVRYFDGDDILNEQDGEDEDYED